MNDFITIDISTNDHSSEDRIFIRRDQIIGWRVYVSDRHRDPEHIIEIYLGSTSLETTHVFRGLRAKHLMDQLVTEFLPTEENRVA
jgi:hypothetical protein